MTKEEVRATFSALSLTIREAWDVFRIVDRDQSQLVSLDEFIFGCQMLSGNAKHVDMVVMMEDMKRSISLLHRSVLDLAGRRAKNVGAQPAWAQQTLGRLERGLDPVRYA